MKTIAVITSTRAEFGLLSPLIKELREYESIDFVVELVVTGAHLNKELGLTVSEIQNNDLRIDVELEIPMLSETPADISNNQACVLNKFTELFLEKEYAAIVILGDRYEMLAVAISAVNTHIPIFHLCGGDTTEGAVDEWIRHSITKMSYMHFPTNEVSRRRIIQMGENPAKVFNFGSTSIDNIKSMLTFSKSEALGKIGLKDSRYALCTYHPETMAKEEPDKMMREFISAIVEFEYIEFVVTKANADCGGSRINQILEQTEPHIKNMHVFSSLGAGLYLSLMKNAEFVLGNSSSGIVEAPYLGIPTINIGDRQKGRIQADSIINCGNDKKEISLAIEKACSNKFRNSLKAYISPYGDGQAGKRIAGKIFETVSEENIDLKKKFYDWGI